VALATGPNDEEEEHTVTITTDLINQIGICTTQTICSQIYLDTPNSRSLLNKLPVLITLSVLPNLEPIVAEYVYSSCSCTALTSSTAARGWFKRYDHSEWSDPSQAQAVRHKGGRDKQV
jgi:hypothetical protein